MNNVENPSPSQNAIPHQNECEKLVISSVGIVAKGTMDATVENPHHTVDDEMIVESTEITVSHSLECISQEQLIIVTSTTTRFFSKYRAKSETCIHEKNRNITTPECLKKNPTMSVSCSHIERDAPSQQTLRISLSDLNMLHLKISDQMSEMTAEEELGVRVASKDTTSTNSEMDFANDNRQLIDETSVESSGTSSHSLEPILPKEELEMMSQSTTTMAPISPMHHEVSALSIAGEDQDIYRASPAMCYDNLEKPTSIQQAMLGTATSLVELCSKKVSRDESIHCSTGSLTRQTSTDVGSLTKPRKFHYAKSVK